MVEIFGTDNHKIIHSDVLQALKEQVSDNSIDLIFADPLTTLVKTSTVIRTNGQRTKII